MTPSKRLLLLLPGLLALIFFLGAGLASAQDVPPPADIVNDEGGPVQITGVVTYTAPFFTDGVAQPVIITEDQAGFVDRNEYFIMPTASQTLGQLTSDFYESPFSYSLTLPVEPQGSYRDVDQDDEDETGVQVYAIADRTNTFGDAFLEERDLYGGGWSTAYASTRVSTDPETEREIIGGDFLIYAPDETQGFPSGFGEDGLLFTADDPIVTVPQGYTMVNMDSDPFTFDRSRYQVIDLIEPEGAALVDLADLAYDEAFNQLVDILINEYAFTEYKEMDREALRAEFLPRFEEAAAAEDQALYERALRDFVWRIPDAHFAGDAPIDFDEFGAITGGGLGIAMRELDDGTVIVTFVLDGSPAAEAGIELGTEIVAVNDVPIAEHVSNALADWAGPFSTEHVRRLQQLRYASRFPLDEDVDVTFVNADGEEETATLTPVPERDSFRFSSFSRNVTGMELPVEYRLLDSGYAYVKISGFQDNSLLTIQLWERLMTNLNENQVPGLIIDMRQNSGGFSFLANQMAAYFFNEPLVLGNTAGYDEERGEFYVDPRGERRFYLPAEELRYNGKIAVLVGPSCASACEFFSYNLTLNDRATIVGQYPTAGAGGGITDLQLPGPRSFRYSIGRNLDVDGNVIIEGVGIQPEVLVPVTAETLLTEGDPVLDAAVDLLSETNVIVEDGGAIAIGNRVEGSIEQGVRVRYTLEVSEGDVINIYMESEEIDSALSIYDVSDTLLFANDDLEGQDTFNAGVEGLEIPANLTLVLEVYAINDNEAGSFVLRVEAAEEAAVTGEDDSEATEGETAVVDMSDMTIAEIVAAREDLSFLTNSLGVADMLAELDGDGPFTLFAPNNDAFAALDPEVTAAIVADPPALAEVLRYHTVADAVTAEAIVNLGEMLMLTGDIVTVTVDGDDVLVGNATVVEADIIASNGVIHIVDTVLELP